MCLVCFVVLSFLVFSFLHIFQGTVFPESNQNHQFLVLFVCVCQLVEAGGRVDVMVDVQLCLIVNQ